MDIKKYQISMLERQRELLYTEPSSPTEKAIIDLEMMICEIRPYSLAWRSGRIKSLRMAINALKG